MNNHECAHLHCGPRTRLGHESGSSVQNLSIWSPLKNAVFHALWLASASLLSGSAVSAREMAATWLMNTLTPSPLLISLMSTVCDFAFLSVHASCWSNGRRIRSKEAALFSESLVGDCGGRPGDRHTVRVRESLPDPWKRFPAGCRLSGRRASMDGGIPEVVIKEDLPSAITFGGLQFTSTPTWCLRHCSLPASEHGLP